MLDFRAAGVLGATVIVAGGVAYLVWRHSEEKVKGRPAGGGGAGEVERSSSSSSAAPPVIQVTPAPTAAQVQRLTHLPHINKSTPRSVTTC